MAPAWRARAAAAASAAVLVAVAATAAPALAIRDEENKVVGGGWVATGIGNPKIKVHFAINLPCPAAEVGFNPQPDPPGRAPAHLRVNWGHSHLRLTELAVSACSLGGPDTIEGSGVGMCDGEGVTVSFRFTDGGERGVGNPVRPDFVDIDIQGEVPACTLSVGGPVGGGNVNMIGNPNE